MGVAGEVGDVAAAVKGHMHDTRLVHIPSSAANSPATLSTQQRQAASNGKEERHCASDRTKPL